MKSYFQNPKSIQVLNIVTNKRKKLTEELHYSGELIYIVSFYLTQYLNVYNYYIYIYNYGCYPYPYFNGLTLVYGFRCDWIWFFSCRFSCPRHSLRGPTSSRRINHVSSPNRWTFCACCYNWSC